MIELMARSAMPRAAFGHPSDYYLGRHMTGITKRWHRALAALATAALLAAAGGQTAIAADPPPETESGVESGSAFHPLPYTQLKSTLNSSAKLSSTTPLTLQVSGVGGVPTSGVAAVSLDVTTTNSTSSSWVSVTPADGGSGITNHFTTPGRQAQNNVYVALSADGKIKVSTGGQTTDAVIAITGYFSDDPGGSSFVPATSANRLLDTRTTTALQPGASVTVQLPSSRPANTNAAGLSVTTIGATNRGWLSIGSDATNQVGLDYDTASASSSLISAVSSSGSFTVTNKGGTATQVLVDLQGFFTQGADGGEFQPAPSHLYDTRTDGVAVPAGAELRVPAAGEGSLPSGGISAYAVDVTVLSGDTAGYVQVYPASSAAFGYGTVNFEANERRSNSALLAAGNPASPDDIIVRNRSNAPIHVLVDAMGYFTSTTPDSISRDYLAPEISAAGADECWKPIEERTGAWVCIGGETQAQSTTMAAQAREGAAAQDDSVSATASSSNYCTIAGCWDVLGTSRSEFSGGGMYGAGKTKLGDIKIFIRFSTGGGDARSNPIYFTSTRSITGATIEGERLYVSSAKPYGHPVKGNTYSIYGPTGVRAAGTQIKWGRNGYYSYENTVSRMSVVHNFVWKDTSSAYPGRWFFYVKSNVAKRQSSGAYHFEGDTSLPKDPAGSGYRSYG